MKKLLLVVIVALSILSGCKVRERIVIKEVDVPRIVIRTDSVLIVRTDSFVVKTKGDSVFIERYKTIYKDRIKLEKDTVTKLVTIDVPVDREVIRYKWGVMSWVGLILSLGVFAWVVLKLKKLFV